MTDSNLKTLFSRDTLASILRVVLGIVLFYSSTVHLANPYQFYSAVLAYGIVPEKVSLALAAILPFLQLVLSVFLIFAISLRSTTIIASVMFAVFLVAQSVAVAQGNSVSCGCFGSMSMKVGLVSFIEVLLSCFASVWLFSQSRSNPVGVANHV